MSSLDRGQSASSEMADRIHVLKRRITVFDREQIQEAERVLDNARADLAHDERLLAEWQDIANRSA